MSRGAYSFKQRDVTRAINAAKAAGIAIGRVEVDKNGKIVIVTGQPQESPAAPNVFEIEAERLRKRSNGGH
jgi:hypothetical protein